VAPGAKAVKEPQDSASMQVEVGSQGSFSLADRGPGADEESEGMETGQSLILLTLGLVALLSGMACYYFSLFRPRRPAVIVMLLTAFIFWQDLLWGSVYALAMMRYRLVTFEMLVRGLFWPVFLVGLLGALGTGLLFLLIVRRELR
jgi:hypothetical protein